MSSNKDDTPEWLKGDGNSSSYGQVPQSEQTTESAPAEDPTKEIPRMILYARIFNLILSVLMILVSFLSLLTTASATTGVLSVYVMAFSCLLCCYETHLKQVSKVIAFNFGFLYGAKPRACFLVFLGSILFSFNLFGKIVGLAMFANAGFNIYLQCKYPDFDQAQRKDAQSEIADYLAANPAFTKQMVSFGLASATTVAQNNPELVQQAAQEAQQAAMAYYVNQPNQQQPQADHSAAYANL
jgi:hypothetical protein